MKTLGKAAVTLIIAFVGLVACGAFFVTVVNLGDDDRSPASSAPAASTTAPPTKIDDTDERFIDLLETEGVPIARQDALMLAAAVCGAYKKYPDTTIHEASLELMKQHPGWSPEQAATFVGGAVGGYCPEYRNF